MPAANDLLIRGTRANPPSRAQGVPAAYSGPEEPAESIDRDRLADMNEWHLACRIAASQRLCKSDLLPKFLLYICEQTLMGMSYNISEQRIGIRIFNRPTDYNPGEDNIVRSYARTLRKRMEEYFDAEGRWEPLRIEIPRGGYVPIFVTNGNSSSDNERQLHPLSAGMIAAPLDPIPTQMSPMAPPDAGLSSFMSPQQLMWVTGLILLLVACVLGAYTLGATRGHYESVSQEVAHPIWSELFQKDRNTLIVPADSGLGILQNLTGKQISLENYANRSYFAGETLLPGIDARNLADLREQRYTSVVDLNIAAKLMQMPELSAGRTDIRYARSVTAEDLKSSNVILLGSSHTNPWVSLFEDHMNFRLQYSAIVDRSMVLNERPNGKEQKQYLNGTDLTPNRTYGVIGYLPNLDGGGHVLIIQGLNMAATQAAADVLFYSPDMRLILDRARLQNGSLRPFELLIQTSSIGATDRGAEIIATRFYD